MRINVLQHTPNEGPGSIKRWSQERGHEMYVYHPYQFGNLPTSEQTDMLVILGGPMSPNDDFEWISQERDLVRCLLAEHKPILGICYGDQLIAKALGYEVKKAPHKEVGWAPVYLESDIIPNIPDQLIALHWHEEMFELPAEAELLFSSNLLENQGFILNGNIIGLQFHFEPETDGIREIVINDDKYPLEHNALHQTSSDIIEQKVPNENRKAMYQLLDFITG